jgi:gliding motility-associated-like protein
VVKQLTAPNLYRMIRIKIILATILFFCCTVFVFGQITAPQSIGSFQTNYTPEFISEGQQNDFVYLFCSDHLNDSVGELFINSPGCDIVWYEYDGISFVENGQTGTTASDLNSGLYMATVDCGGVISCYRAWVWVNQRYVSINSFPNACETFTLSADVQVMDHEFWINDPPGSNFPVDEDTYIKVCFWAEHTYVSDLGFFLKAPGYQTAEPGEVGVVELSPSPSDWGPGAQFGSWTGIEWSVLGCSDPSDENSVCNSGDDISEFCFITHTMPGGMEIPSSSPMHTPCVCDLPTPLTGSFGSVGPWAPIYGANAADPGWTVQIYDCEDVDEGGLTRATITIIGETDCGTAYFNYDSGDILSPINDGSCDALSASIFIVPPTEPQGLYSVSSQITDYNWTSTGSAFTGEQQSHQIVYETPDFPSDTSTFTITVTETFEVPGNFYCQSSASAFFQLQPSDASIIPVSPTCPNGEPIVLQTATGGGNWATNAPGGSLVDGIFYPETAGPGVWNVSYEILGDCADSDNINITVYETIDVINFIDNSCNPTNTEYTVSFDVINSMGNPADFFVDFGTGNQPYNGNFSRTYLNTAIYSLTITDVNGCYEYHYTGTTDCLCATFAGNMTSLNPINLCEEECSPSNLHQGNENLDGDDILEFVLNTGAYPAVPILSNNNSLFCFTDIPDGVYGQTYYITPIAGNNVGGHVDPEDHCYSQTLGTPVIWYEQPDAEILSPDYQEICGTTISLSAEPAQSGMSGFWTANADFYPGSGTTIYSPDVTLVVNDFGSVTFYWNVNNGFCTAKDSVIVSFKQEPSAYAGENFSICGTQAELNAVPSVEGSSGQWFGSGNFVPNTSPNANVTVNSNGQFVFTWRESVADCWDEDNVSVTFIAEPNPTVLITNDTVCGIAYNLMVYNVTPSSNGTWTAYYDGELMSPAPVYQPNSNTPNATALIGNYDGLYKEVEFVWTETMQSQGQTCEGEVSISVVFAKQPVASVGANDAAEICGNCISLNADTTGSGWASGRWVAKDIIAWFEDDNPYIPDASVCIDPLGTFGDTAHVEVEFLWIMTNYGCNAVDTMNVTFYKRPVANAGLDDAICGRDYNLGAVYNIPQSSGYNPGGGWSVHSKPVSQASANIVPLNQDSVAVTVSHYGQWVFQFRENNTFLTGCYSTDTVRIEFVEIPVVDAGEDKHVCGQCTQLEATSSDFSGTWLDNGAMFENNEFNNPNANVCVNSYGSRDFIWMESNQAQTTFLTCTSLDTVEITFWRVPQAVILTDEADSTTCGLTFQNLRAQQPGTGITGFWWNETDSDADYGDPNSHNTNVTVSNYGYHDFYWVCTNGPTFQPDFCIDTAGPLRIHFIEIPTANAGGDTLFCGYTGYLNAIPTIGTGVWSTPSSELVFIENINDPNSFLSSQVLNTGNATYPYFNLIWTEDNTNGCTDKDTIKVIFARVPNSGFDIVPPKCIGEPATFSAQEDSLQQYQWNFYTGVIDSTVNNDEYNANYQHFVYWANDDTAHRVTLIVTNFWECQSAITIDTVYEPPIPDFGTILVGDTCSLGRGAIIIEDTVGTNAFYWLNEDVGPNPGTPITAVYNLPEGEYDIRARYRTPNQAWYNYYITVFGNAMCTDTITYNIEAIGHLIADFEIPLDVFLDELVAPEAEVTFVNNSDYGGVRRRCIWHFGDGTTLTSCDDIVYHTYTEADCYYPFLIVMNRDLQECRDTAFLDPCIEIDNASSIEVPNIFTPNGDGINDFFQVKAQTLREFNGYIVNRWGNVLFEWTNWQNEEAGWDGKMPGGTKASAGVYFYIVKATGMDDEPYDLYGVLHLIRD